MKYSVRPSRWSLLLAATFAATLTSAFASHWHSQTSVPIPAIKDGSNWSRAPFLAVRPDAPVSQTTPIAIEQPAQPVAIARAQTVSTEPYLTPTGRITVEPRRPVAARDMITPPAIKDGSNWSRAPFPAQRQFDDVR